MKRLIAYAMMLTLATVMLALAGCDTAVILKTQIEQKKATLTEIEMQGAKICAPKEYAAAEAHLDFAQEEWNERDYIECQDHLVIVQQKIDSAKKWLTNCVEQLPPDKDGDGILDDVDKCPDEPEDKDAFEDEDGCPDPDNDKDGILDAADKCPNEAEVVNGSEDEDGCPDEQTTIETDNIKVEGDEIKLKRMINFETGRSDIKPESFAILYDIAEVLKKQKNWKIRIEGHTDTQGSHATNMRLSQSRADSCKMFLVQQGVDPSRLMTVGYGPDKPIGSNATSEGRAMNRRTEFKITAKD